MIKEIKIGGHIFKVLYPYQFREKRVDGQCDSNQNEIRLAQVDYLGAELAQSNRDETFCHEILHAINSVYCNDNIEEDDIEHMAQGLFQVLKDNFRFSFLEGKIYKGA